MDVALFKESKCEFFVETRYVKVKLGSQQLFQITSFDISITGQYFRTGCICEVAGGRVYNLQLSRES
jgi:hypothetical protein